MGNIVHKAKVHPEPLNVVMADEVQNDDVVVNEVQNDDVANDIKEKFIEAIMFPVTPSEDVVGKYIWVNLNLRDPQFIQYQEQGFKISTNNKDLTVGRVWLKKKRN